MSYIEKNLMKGEDIKYSAKISWLAMLPGIITIAISMILMMTTQILIEMEASGNIEDSSYIGFPAIVGIVLFCVGLRFFVPALFAKITTKLVVTNKRIVARAWVVPQVGLGGMQTIEVNHGNVGNYPISQSILGRMLGYGTVVIRGGEAPILNLDSPMDFSKAAMKAAVDLQSA